MRSSVDAVFRFNSVPVGFVVSAAAFGEMRNDISSLTEPLFSPLKSRIRSVFSFFRVYPAYVPADDGQRFYPETVEIALHL